MKNPIDPADMLCLIFTVIPAIAAIIIMKNPIDPITRLILIFAVIAPILVLVLIFF